MPVTAAWCAAIVQLGGGAEPARHAGTELARRWAEPHRHYHTTAHLEAVLRDTSWLADEMALDGDDRAIVTLAACAHDVVYDARPGADEQASAEWARSRLASCGLPTAPATRVAGLVLATLDHRADEHDVAAAVLLDADLAVLGGDREAYARYVAAIRAEYAHVPDDAFRAGRARVLRTLLDRHPLYRTRPARERWEAPARANLAGELGVPPPAD